MSVCLISLVSCDDNTNTPFVDNYDHEGQIPEDEAVIQEFLETHYLNDNDLKIWTIGNGTEDQGALPENEQIPLIDDARLNTVEGIEIDGVDAPYKMHYIKLNQGSENNTSPYPIDSVYVNYTAMLLDSTVVDENPTYPIWFNLSGLIRAWSYALPYFKGGDLIINQDQSFSFENYGEGYFILPQVLVTEM